MRTVNVIFLLIFLCGCGATPYQPKGRTGGFSETQLDTNVFRVSFRGNALTQVETVQEFALLRSAELTLINGFTHFAIADTNSNKDISAFTMPASSYTTGNATIVGNSAYGNARTTTYGGQTLIISQPTNTNIIVCFKEKPNIQALVYDAEFICDSLGRKYK